LQKFGPIRDIETAAAFALVVTSGAIFPEHRDNALFEEGIIRCTRPGRHIGGQTDQEPRRPQKRLTNRELHSVHPNRHGLRQEGTIVAAILARVV